MFIGFREGITVAALLIRNSSGDDCMLLAYEKMRLTFYKTGGIITKIVCQQVFRDISG